MVERVGWNQWTRTEDSFYFEVWELAQEFIQGINNRSFVAGCFHNLHHRALQSSVFLGRHAACTCTRNSFSSVRPRFRVTKYLNLLPDWMDFLNHNDLLTKIYLTIMSSTKGHAWQLRCI